MDINELNRLSPIRRFEDSINGGLGRGNLGVIVSKHGVGKTACLVHLATDKLLKGESVVHVSFNGNVEHVIGWYKELYKEIAGSASLDDAANVFQSILENRVVMNFSQENVGVKRVLSSLKSLIAQGSFKADCVLFDGYRMTIADDDDIIKIKNFAKEMGLEVWFSVSPVRSNVVYDEYGVPDTLLKYYDLIDVLVALKYAEESEKVMMTVVRAHHRNIPHPAKTMLDPETMLILS